VELVWDGNSCSTRAWCRGLESVFRLHPPHTVRSTVILIQSPIPRKPPRWRLRAPSEHGVRSTHTYEHLITEHSTLAELQTWWYQHGLQRATRPLLHGHPHHQILPSGLAGFQHGPAASPCQVAESAWDGFLGLYGSGQAHRLTAPPWTAQISQA